MAHPIDTIYPTGVDVSKPSISAEMRLYAREFATAAVVRGLSLDGTPNILVGGVLFKYDSADATTVDNGTTCIVDSGSRRFKTVLGTAALQPSTAFEVAGAVAAAQSIDALDNLAFDPWFQIIRTIGAVDLSGRVLTAGPNGAYSTTTKLLNGTQGAWKFSNPTLGAGLFGFYNFVDGHGILAGDAVSVGILCQAGVGEQINSYANFANNSGTGVGSQVGGPSITGTGAVQLVQINNITIPAGATAVTTYFTPGSVSPSNFAIIALWVVKGATAGALPPKRITSDFYKSASKSFPPLSTSLKFSAQSLFPDPYFEVMQNTSSTFGGQSYFHSILTNYSWNATIKRSFGGAGGWKHTSGGGLTGFKVPYASAGLSAGDVISIGCILVASITPSTPTMYLRPYSGSDANYTGSQVGQNVDVNGAQGNATEQTFQLNNITVVAGDTGIIIYFGDGATPSDTNILALWMIKGGDAGITPPPHTNQLLVQNLANGGVDPTPTISPDALIMPPRICGIVGRPMTVRSPNLRAGKSSRLFDWNGSQGLQTALGFYNPTPIAGDSALSVTVADQDSGIIKGSASSTLSITAANAPAGATRKLLVIGDSLVAVSGGNTGWTQRLLDVASANPQSVQLNMIGTQGTSPNLNEGQGGWSIPRYYAPGVTYYASNPFTQASSSLFNFNYYLTHTSQATPDIVAVCLGTNDVINSVNDAAALTASLASITNLDAMIGITTVTGVTSWKSVSSTIKTLLVVEAFGSNNLDNWGTDYGMGLTSAQGRRNIAIFAKALIDHYGAMEGQNIFICGAHLFVDLDAGYTTSAVHPRGTGYASMGDAVSDTINVLVAKGLM